MRTTVAALALLVFPALISGAAQPPGCEGTAVFHGDDDEPTEPDPGDDDTAPLDQAGAAFRVEEGATAGPYRFTWETRCEWEQDRFVIQAAEDPDWTEFVTLRLAEEPGPGTHVEQGLRVELLLTPWWMQRDEGGSDCFLDAAEDGVLSGTFECAGMQAYADDLTAVVAIAEGQFRCD